MKPIKFIMIFSLIVCFKSYSFMMSPPQTNTKLLIGHEEITREGIDLAKMELKNLGEEDIYEFPQFMVPGNLSKNKVVRGNFLTDVPDKFRNNEIGLRTLYKIKDNEDWHTHGKLQSIHSLRDYNVINSLKKSCQRIQAKIVKVSQLAYLNYKKGNVLKAYNLLGHATHIIQDSFSPAHVKRVKLGEGFETANLIKDICIYGKNKKRFSRKKGICYHRLADHRDYVWNKIPSRRLINSLDSLNSNIGQMNDLAIDAAYATSFYLVIMAKVFLIPQDVSMNFYIKKELLKLFESKINNPFIQIEERFLHGILNCKNL